MFSFQKEPKWVHHCCAVILASLFQVIWAEETSAQTPAERPNVLMITIDDLNDWVGCLGGHPQSKTPNIDALIKRGILFTNSHCQAPICNPSRVSFMTGVRPSTSGIYMNGDRFRSSKRLKNAITIPQHFAANGYVSMGCGKLFHASGGRNNFQVYGPFGGQGPLPKKRLNCPPEASSSKLWDWGTFPAKEEDYHDVINSKWASEQLSQELEKPFFIGVGLYRPHVPFYAPERFFDLHPLKQVALPEIFPKDIADVPEYGRKLTHNSLPPDHAWFVKSGKWRQAVQSYLAAISFTDANVGRVIQALDAGPHADNTWIVLLSDHGFFLGEKKRWAKQSLWERATKTPLVIVPPRNLSNDWAKDRTCAAPVELLSLYPTLIELCGLPYQTGLEGTSIVPLLRQPDSNWERPAITTYQQGNHSIRTSRWRYTRYADGSEELYDLQTDPNEWHNLAPRPEASDIIEELRKWLPTHNQQPPRE